MLGSLAILVLICFSMQESLQIEDSCSGELARYESQISGIEKPTLNKKTLQMADSIDDSYDVEDETSLDRSGLLTDDKFKRPIPSNYYYQPVENDSWGILEKASPERRSFWKYFFMRPYLQNQNQKFKKKPSTQSTKTSKTTAPSFWTYFFMKPHLQPHNQKLKKKPTTTKRPGSTSKKPRPTSTRGGGSYGNDNNIDIQVDVEIHREPTKPEQEESTEYEYHPLTSHLTHKPPELLSFQPVR